MADNIYVKGIMYAKKNKFSLKISFKVDEFIEFLKANKNDKGYCNIEQKEFKTPKEADKPYYYVLDTYVRPIDTQPTVRASVSDRPAIQPSADLIDGGLPF